MSDGMDLDGKVALVTGGSRGIGAAVVRRLARSGAAVAFTYLAAEDRARAVVKEVEAEGGRAVAIAADNASAEEVIGAVESAAREYGRLDILVNNAGVFPRGMVDEVSLAELDHTLAVNVRAAFVASQAAARRMTGDGDGRIINISSCVAERLPVPGLTLYAMTKSALTGLTKGLARELGPRGITAVVVQPGPIDTDMNPHDGPAADFQRAATALGRFGEVDEVASLVAYLAGPGGRYITGTSISVDGGFAA